MTKQKSPANDYADVTIYHPKGSETIVEGAVPAYGECVIPNDGEMTEVYGAIVDQGSALPSDEDIYEHEMAVDVSGDEWNFNGLYCNPGNYNFKALCHLEITDGDPLRKTGVESFTASYAKKKKKSKSSRLMAGGGVPLEHSRTHPFFGTWLLYIHLSVTDKHYGNRLMLRGNELRASQISIFAEDVLWRSEEGGEYVEIRRPTGNGQPADPHWRFRNANQYAICVHQARGWEKTVRATSFLRPTRVPLDADRPIYLNVNDRRRPSSDDGYGGNSGSFNVWVRVDSE